MQSAYHGPDEAFGDWGGTEQTRPNGRAKPRRIRSISLQELQGLQPLEYQIKGIYYKNSLAVIYGPSNCGKTFLVLDQVLSAARMMEWFGKRVKPAKVCYIACEGGQGLQNRWNAYAIHHNLGIKTPPLRIIPVTVNLRDGATDLNDLLADIAENGGADIIVIDTLSRAMAGGDENSPNDMGEFVGNCDRIREATKALILIIHHSGKNVDMGARGHSSLLGNIDTELKVTKDKDHGTLTAEITKQRDSRIGEKFHFFLKVVVLGTDEDGDPITSCVIEETNSPPKAKDDGLTGRKKRAHDILKDLLDASGELGIPKKGMPEITFVRIDTFRAALNDANLIVSDKPDNKRRGISAVIEELNTLKIIGTWGDKIWITGQTGQARTDRN